MDTATHTELANRLTELELALGPVTGQTIQTQLHMLQKSVHDIYKHHGELVELNRIITELGLWDAVDPVDPVDVESQRGDHTVSTDEKHKLVLLKSESIKQAHNNAMQLAALDITRLVNFVASANDKTLDFNELHDHVQQRQAQLEHISRKFHWLVLKSMVVVEAYLQRVNDHNSFWLQANERLAALQRGVSAREKQRPRY